jgi:aquaporin Z
LTDAAAPESRAPEHPAAPQPAVGGFHVAEWGAEFVGTAILVFAALSTLTIMFRPGSAFEDWIPSKSARLLLLGAVFAIIIVAIATSPLGRLSGAHLNPAVTLAFWITGHVHPHDLFGYWAAQILGGFAGVVALRAVWGGTAAGVNYGAISPSVGPGAAVLIEALMVAVMLGAMFLFLSEIRLARWTPVAAGVVVALATWLGATRTGTGLNFARTLGPNLVSGDWLDWWVYLVGPLLGAVLVATLWRAGPRIILTAKLFHDSRYRSVLRTHLPARPAHAPARPADTTPPASVG